MPGANLVRGWLIIATARSGPHPLNHGTPMTPSETPAERRRAPRFPVRLAVVTAGITLYTTNLSSSGAQLVCPTLPRSLLDHQLETQRLQLSIQLPDGEEAALEGSVVYESSDGNESLLGIHFVAFAPGARQRLYRYIEQRAGPGFLPEDAD